MQALVFFFQGHDHSTVSTVISREDAKRKIVGWGKSEVDTEESLALTSCFAWVQVVTSAPHGFIVAETCLALNLS